MSCWMILVSLETLLVILGVLEAGLNFDVFSGIPWEAQVERIRPLEGKKVDPGVAGNQ